ncbi:MAG: nickel pincer cofactor biosynthesis protein LarC [Calditrichaeota bacterium]|nr:MAG: nickel pincer cofactor biosynthesis protein LarC [Calditrichota bacterium]
MDFLYFDCVGGAAGDMILGALTDGLVPLDHVRQELHRLKLAGFHLESKRVFRHHIDSHKVTVRVTEKEPPHRHLKDILTLIDNSDLSVFVKRESRALFTRLGEQEARAHRMEPEKVHFHEVGAIDSIVDIVGTCIALEYLNVSRIYASPLPVGSGVFRAAHGVLPTPAPASLRLMHGFPLKRTSVHAEQVTPTGAALITHFADGPLPDGLEFIVHNHGLGAGDKDFAEVPNFMRVWRGTIREADHAVTETVQEITCDVDDMNPEHVPFIADVLLKHGALDVSITQQIMKQGRPGFRLTVLSAPDKRVALSELLFKHTTTIGLRYHTVTRRVLPRETDIRNSPWGDVAIKKIHQPDGSVRIEPEYRSCQALAEKHNISIRDIQSMLRALFNQT